MRVRFTELPYTTVLPDPVAVTGEELPSCPMMEYGPAQTSVAFAMQSEMSCAVPGQLIAKPGRPLGSVMGFEETQPLTSAATLTAATILPLLFILLSPLLLQ
jgi:hypothetical protein